MIARLTVQRGALTEYPLAERTRGGWQNGVTFYPDADVVKAIPLTVVEQADREPSDAEVLAALNARELSVRERSGSARYFNPAPDLSFFDEGTIADTRAALISAQEVRDVS